MNNIIDKFSFQGVLHDIEPASSHREATEASLGYEVLYGDKTFISQVTKANTIYEIRDYFDLSGETNGEPITLPENCVLKFEGGLLANGTINGNGVTIEAPLVRIFSDNITLKGNFNCDFYPEWFGAVIYTKDTAVDNTAVFNNAITQIYNMNGAHDLILTGAYLIKDTIFLKPKVSLIGRYGRTRYDIVVGDKEIGSGFLVDFEDNNRYAIDTCVTQLDKNGAYTGKKQAIIKYNYLWLDSEATAENSYTLSDNIVGTNGHSSINAAVDNSITNRLWVNGWKKSTNIKNITLQPLNKPTQSSEIPFGGIRLIGWYSGTIDSVTIQGFAVCLNVAESWACCINRLNITTYYIGVYLGKHCTQYDIRNSDIERVGSVVFNHKDAALVYRSKTNLLLPYDEEGKVEGDEGFTHSITKYIATPESVDETFISTNYPGPNTNSVTLEQGTVSETGLLEVSSNYCRTPMFTKFRLNINTAYTISKIVQYDLNGTFIASYDTGVIDNKNVVWAKTLLQINDTNYKWIAVISKTDNTKTITPSEKIVSSFVSGTYFFNSTQLLTVAIMTESFIYDQTKLLVDNVIFQFIDGILINTNTCNVSFNFCYIEGVTKLGLYSHSGTVQWLNPSTPGNVINPYAAVTFEGKITIENMISPRCYPSYTMEDVKSVKAKPRYYVTPQALYYDKFIVRPKDNNVTMNQGVPISGTVAAGSVAAAKQLVPINNTYYVGAISWIGKWDWNYYTELNAGLESNSWIPFKKVLELYDPKVATFRYVFGNDDFSAGGMLLKNKDFTIIRYDGTSSHPLFDSPTPMRLQDSNVKFIKLKIACYTEGKNIFEVAGKCSIWADSSDGIIPHAKIVKLVSEDNRPVELDFFFNRDMQPYEVYNNYLSHLNEYGIKYTLRISTPKGNSTYINTTPPTIGVAKGETFIYNGKTLVWNGSSWDTQLIPNYDLYVALGAEYNNTGANITKTSPWGTTVTHKNGCWYYNGLGDLSTNDMSQIYSHKDILMTNATFPNGTVRQDLIRTNIPMEFAQNVSKISINSVRFFFRCAKIQVLRWAWKGISYYDQTEVTFDTTNTNVMPKMGANMEGAFGECYKLQYIYPINVSNTTSLLHAFRMGVNCGIRDVRLYGLKTNVDFKECPYLTKACLTYIISNANPTTAITITLHADAYTNIGFGDENSEISTLLNDKNLALSANGGSINLLSA